MPNGNGVENMGLFILYKLQLLNVVVFSKDFL